VHRQLLISPTTSTADLCVVHRRSCRLADSSEKEQRRLHDAADEVPAGTVSGATALPRTAGSRLFDQFRQTIARCKIDRFPFRLRLLFLIAAMI
jgi:hypothetical protein